MSLLHPSTVGGRWRWCALDRLLHHDRAFQLAVGDGALGAGAPREHVFFMKVPLAVLVEEGRECACGAVPKGRVLAAASDDGVRRRVGARHVPLGELFAELGLGVSKTVGDPLGPLRVAVLMGVRAGVLRLEGRHLPWSGSWRGPPRCARPVPGGGVLAAAAPLAPGLRAVRPQRGRDVAGAIPPPPTASPRAAPRCSRCWRWRAIWAAPAGGLVGLVSSRVQQGLSWAQAAVPGR